MCQYFCFSLFQALIDDKDNRESSLLAVSIMVNNYCKKMTACDQDPTVVKVMASIEGNIGYRCDASGKNFEKVLFL